MQVGSSGPDPQHVPVGCASHEGVATGGVLIVDDDAPVRKVFELILRADIPGCRILLAADGREAVHAFVTRRPTVMVMDLCMPVMDGQQAFSEIARRCAELDIRMPSVVFCTGYAPPASLDEIIRRDSAHCLLRKPVSTDDLVSAVRRRLPAGEGGEFV